MYGKIATGAGTGVAADGILPFTGWNVAGITVAVIVLTFAGLALLKLLPQRRNHSDIDDDGMPVISSRIRHRAWTAMSSALASRRIGRAAASPPPPLPPGP